MEDRYLIINRHKVYVSYGVWQYYVSDTNHIHYRTRKAKECRANGKQMAACNGDCHTCWYWTSKGISVDALAERNGYLPGMYAQADPDMLLRCQVIVAIMAQTIPDGARMAHMIMRGDTVHDIVQVLGISRSTYNRRLRRVRRALLDTEG